MLSTEHLRQPRTRQLRTCGTEGIRSANSLPRRRGLRRPPAQRSHRCCSVRNSEECNIAGTGVERNALEYARVDSDARSRWRRFRLLGRACNARAHQHQRGRAHSRSETCPHPLVPAIPPGTRTAPRTAAFAVRGSPTRNPSIFIVAPCASTSGGRGVCAIHRAPAPSKPASRQTTILRTTAVLDTSCGQSSLRC